MSEVLPFCKIKLQYLLEMVTDHELNDNALRMVLNWGILLWHFWGVFI